MHTRGCPQTIVVRDDIVTGEPRQFISFSLRGLEDALRRQLNSVMISSSTGTCTELIVSCDDIKVGTLIAGVTCTTWLLWRVGFAITHAFPSRGCLLHVKASASPANKLQIYVCNVLHFRRRACARAVCAFLVRRFLPYGLSWPRELRAKLARLVWASREHGEWDLAVAREALNC